MRGIRVIAKKVAKSGIIGFNDKIFINYINKLTLAAQKTNGFQNTRSYWEKDYNNIVAFSISDWDSEKDWNKWLNSKNRKNINNEHKNVILSEEFNVLIKSKNSDNTFLL